VQERGVDRAQAVEVALGHGKWLGLRGRERSSVPSQTCPYTA
jgi:hypothetical protein